MARDVYVYRDGRMVHKHTGEPMVDGPGPVVAPLVMPDTAGYRSPIDGKWIEGRRARRYDLESNDCIDVGGQSSKRMKNRRFMEKWKLGNE